MINKHNIAISILYKRQSSDVWYKKVIDAEDYFDIEYVDENEFLEIDTIPIFDKAIDYICEENKQDITNTKLTILNIDTNESRAINTSYWNNQNNIISERIDKNSEDEVIFREVILTSLTSQNLDEDIWEVIRFAYREDVLVPQFHSFITENKDGLVSERVIIL